MEWNHRFCLLILLINKLPKAVVNFNRRNGVLSIRLDDKRTRSWIWKDLNICFLWGLMKSAGRYIDLAAAKEGITIIPNPQADVVEPRRRKAESRIRIRVCTAVKIPKLPILVAGIVGKLIVQSTQGLVAKVNH